MLSIPRPSPFFAVLPLLCIILNANQRIEAITSNFYQGLFYHTGDLHSGHYGNYGNTKINLANAFNSYIPHEWLLMEEGWKVISNCTPLLLEGCRLGNGSEERGRTMYHATNEGH